MFTSTNFSAFQIINDVLYFSIVKGNGLFAYDINKKQSKFLGFFDYENMNVSELHLSSVLYKNKIIFIPYNGRFLSIYDVEKNTITGIEINKKTNCSFFKGFICGEKLWLIPQCTLLNDKGRKNICIVNLKDFTCEDVENIEEYNKLASGGFFSLGAAFNGEKIYISIYGTEFVVEYDSDSKKSRLIILDKVAGISTVDFIGGYLWVSETVGTNIKKYNIDGKLIEKYGGKDPLNGVRMIKEIIAWGEKIYVFPNQSDKILGICNEVIEIDKGEVYRRLKGVSCVGQIIEYDGKLFIGASGYDHVIVIDESGEIKTIEIKLSRDEITYVNKLSFEKSGADILTEGEVSLSDYIELINQI